MGGEERGSCPKQDFVHILMNCAFFGITFFQSVFLLNSEEDLLRTVITQNQMMRLISLSGFWKKKYRTAIVSSKTEKTCSKIKYISFLGKINVNSLFGALPSCATAPPKHFIYLYSTHPMGKMHSHVFYF
jgi:hypothetical protein